jgi:hypothetical protein
MPLNISIDVDGTLLEANELLALNIREDLLKLKGKGHHLQLWSTGGADYAKKIAAKHNLADLFESFATKPDIAIDDIPESARPVATIKVDSKLLLHHAIELLESKVEGCVESVLCPSPSLKQLVAEMQAGANNAKAKLGDLLIPRVPFHPIPFFGNIESARVITVGLNPAITEFDKHREWESSLDEDTLAFRLVNYFRLAGIQYPPPHGWFSEMSEFLHIVRCPQKNAAAHIDLCPWTSIAPIGLTTARRNRFWELVDEQMGLWLAKTIHHAKHTARLIIILQSPEPSRFERERQARTKQIIERSFGTWSGKIRIKKKEELIEWGWEHKKSLRDFIGLPNIFD